MVTSGGRMHLTRCDVKQVTGDVPHVLSPARADGRSTLTPTASLLVEIAKFIAPVYRTAETINQRLILFIDKRMVSNHRSGEMTCWATFRGYPRYSLSSTTLSVLKSGSSLPLQSSI